MRIRILALALLFATVGACGIAVRNVEEQADPNGGQGSGGASPPGHAGTTKIYGGFAPLLEE